MMVNGERVRRTSLRHFWARGLRYELEWKRVDDTFVADLTQSATRIACLVRPIEGVPSGWAAILVLHGASVHASEHGSLPRAMLACAKAARRGVELRSIAGVHP